MPRHDPSQCEVLVDQLAEEFVLRYRHGERPSLQEYLDRYPELADDIRTLFPALVEMEQVKEDQNDVLPLAAGATPTVRQVGDYCLLREVGRGGMGVVYEAEQVSLNRRVALKVLSPDIAAIPQALERFRREARAAAKLHHTNIVPVFDVGQDGDTCYYAMQFIAGQSLDQIIGELRRLRERSLPGGERPLSEICTTRREDAPRSEVDRLAHSLLTGCFQVNGAAALAEESEAPVSPPEALDASTPHAAETDTSAVLPGQADLSSVCTDRPQYFRSVAHIGWQTAHALAYAHARGIIHRDIKPSNLLLDRAGVVWITDFGLVKTRDSGLTATGDLVGTLRYMAPERFQGEGDERGDVYGLGLTLYELLVLRQAFEARDRLQLIDQIKNQKPIRPRILERRIPRDLETIVLKAIDKEAKRRYQTAEEMAEDLRRFLADEPIKARRISPWGHFRLWARRHPSWAALLLLLLLTAVASTLTALYLRATLARVEAAELDGKHKLWLSYLSQAQARRMSRQSGQRFASLRALKEALALPVPPDHSRDELRTEAIAALCLADLQMASEGGSDTPGARGSTAWGFAIDPTFQRYAVADKEGTVHIHRPSDEKELLQLPGDGWVHEYGGLRFSPDGRFLHHICNTPRGFHSRLWDLDGPQPKAVLEDNHGHLAFRPDSRQCAAVYPDRTMRFLETASGRELRRFPSVLPVDIALLWNPELPQLLIVGRSSLRLLNVDTGAIAATGPNVPGGYSWVAWHPEGRLLAVGGERTHKIYLWDTPTGLLVMPPLEGHNNGGVVMCFNRAGDRLLSTDWAGSGHLWDTRSGRLLLTLPGFFVHLSFSPTDQLVGTKGCSKTRLYHFRRGAELRTVVHRGRNRGYGYRAPCLDPEGRVFAALTEDGIALVDVARGEEAAPLPLPGNGPLCFDTEGALWTYGADGLLRWPVTVEAKTGQRRYGQPIRIFGQTNGERHGSSTDARVVAIPDYGSGALVFHLDGLRLLRQFRLGPQQDVRSCAVSPDGRWVATGSHSLREGAGAKIWDARDGRHVHDLPVGGICGVQFSPDGKWLLTTSDGPRLWAVGIWEEGPRLGGTPLNSWGAFSRDGKLLALGDAPSLVRLVITDTGEEIARLTVPEQTRLIPCGFTPDGTRLLAIGQETTDLYIFDLAAIRAGLAELDLDWDAPLLPASPAPPATPLSIDFEMGDIRQR
jgi:serine/threonine protein kinase/WD40 repeat protein